MFYTTIGHVFVVEREGRLFWLVSYRLALLEGGAIGGGQASSSQNRPSLFHLLFNRTILLSSFDFVVVFWCGYPSSLSYDVRGGSVCALSYLNQLTISTSLTPRERPRTWTRRMQRFEEERIDMEQR